MSSPRQVVDNLLNLYLYDVENNASPLDEEQSQGLEAQKKAIVQAMLDLGTEDLQWLKKKYQAQHQGMVDEIEWREAHEKSRNIPCELAEIALSGLIKRMEDIGRQKATQPQQSANTEAKKIGEETRRLTAVPKKIGEETKRLAAVPRPKATTASLKMPPDLPSSNPTSATPSAPASTTRAKNPSLVPKPKTPVVDNHDAWEEISSSTVTPGQPAQQAESDNPEDRVLNLVDEYLQKHPHVNWQERDKRDETIRKALFQKELEKKKELEALEEGRPPTKSMKKQTREISLQTTQRRPSPPTIAETPTKSKAPLSEPTHKRPTPPNQEDKKKRWWPF